jgi:hypothetical protein
MCRKLKYCNKMFTILVQYPKQKLNQTPAMKFYYCKLVFVWML